MSLVCKRGEAPLYLNRCRSQECRVKKQPRVSSAHDVDAILNRVASIDLSSVITRYARDSQLDLKLAMLHQRELCRYLALCTLYPNEHFPMAGKADNFWHTFLIFTALYRQYCHKLAGAFIDHEPMGASATASDLEKYDRFLHYYRKCFKDEPCATVWPVIGLNNYRVIGGAFRIVSPP